MSKRPRTKRKADPAAVVTAFPEKVNLFLGSALQVLQGMPAESVDCVVTSPPYYGQRDYGVKEQIGLEADPLNYVAHLKEVFAATARILKPSGSLWINLGDTYWSGRGAPCGPDLKNKHRRFVRPQDRRGPHPWCKAKQLLLLPHRVAIALQDDGWILRNDNVWHKTSPTPDPVKDRSASAHEYFFHFVRSRFYYFDFDQVAEPCQADDTVKAPSSVWTLSNPPNFKKHSAVFPQSLVERPIKATLPKKGILLDPFCGSGTALEAALRLRPKCKVVGIDVSADALSEASTRLHSKFLGEETSDQAVASGVFGSALPSTDHQRGSASLSNMAERKTS